MSARAPKPAAKLGVDRCRNPCPCGSVYLRLCDRGGRCYALPILDPEQVDAVCADLIEMRDQLRARADRHAAAGDPDAIAAVAARRRPH